MDQVTIQNAVLAGIFEQAFYIKYALNSISEMPNQTCINYASFHSSRNVTYSETNKYNTLSKFCLERLFCNRSIACRLMHIMHIMFVDLR